MFEPSDQHIIFSADSPQSGKIEVVETSKVRKLLVNGILQSINSDYPHIDRLVWGSVLRLLKEQEASLHKILFLGMGGASMQRLVSQEYPLAELVSIEIDPIIISVAQAYFDSDTIKNHKIINDDALRVIHHPENYGLNKGSFQIVVVDIVIGEEYPDVCKTGNFIDAVRDMCIPGGLVVFIRSYKEHHQEDVDAFVSICEDFLKDCNSLAVAGRTNSDHLLIYGRA